MTSPVRLAAFRQAVVEQERPVALVHPVALEHPAVVALVQLRPAAHSVAAVGQAAAAAEQTRSMR